MYAVKRTPPLFAFGQYIVSYCMEFIIWWFVAVPTYIIKSIIRTNTIFNDSTSFSIILFGFFKPWKNDNNIAGWVIGLIIKSIYIPVLLIAFGLINIIGLLLLLIQISFLPIIIGLIILNPFISL